MHAHSHFHLNGPVAHYFQKVQQHFCAGFYIENLSHKTPRLDYFCLCAFKFMDKHQITALF